MSDLLSNLKNQKTKGKEKIVNNIMELILFNSYIFFLFYFPLS
jgi:hypothetical protein